MGDAVAFAVSPAKDADFGEKDVASAGTREKLLETAIPTKGVVIKAKKANTGIVYVGGSDVDSTECIPLEAGESIPLPIDLEGYEIYLDVSVSGEGVNFVAYKKGV